MHWVGRLRFLLLAAAIVALLAGTASADVQTPLHVELVMPQIPELNQESVVGCTVEAYEPLEDVSLTIALPEGVELVEGDLTWRGGLAAFQPVNLSIKIRVTAPGNRKIRATAFARVSDTMSFSDVSEVFFHAEEGLAVEGYVLDVVPTETAAVSLETGEMVLPTKLADYAPTMAPPVPEPDTATPDNPEPAEEGVTPTGMLTVTGKWYYRDRSDIYTPMRRVYAQLLKGDDDSLLVSDYLDSSGTYTFPAVTNPGAAGFKVRVWCYYRGAMSCDGKAVRVVGLGEGRADGGNTLIGYSASTGVRTSPDGTFDMGTWSIPNGATNEPAWWLIMDLVDCFWWPYELGTGTKMAGGVTTEWSPTSTHGNHNHRTDDGGNIHLTAAAADVEDVIMHEFGHEVQWDGYDQWLPTSDCPSPHYVNRVSGDVCAWIEGFANWYKCVVSDDPVYHFVGGGTFDFENADWDTYNLDDGDQCEGRTCGALWDIGDPVGETWDTCDLDWDYFWDTWYGSTNRDDNFSQFWTRWKADGNPKHHATKALYQNTIDYNTWPTFGGLPNVSTPEDTPDDNAIDLWLYASDPESYDSELEYTIVANTNPACGVSIDAGDFVDINPNTNWYGYSDVTIRCSDGIRSRDDTFRVTVTSVNDAPVLSAIPDTVVEVDSSNNNVYDLWAYASDVENTDSQLNYTITGNTNPSCGAAVDLLDYLDINPAAGWMGYSDVTVRVTDTGGLWDEDTFRVVVAYMSDTISQARNHPDGSWVYLTGKTLTAGFPDYLYMEETDRSAGIRVNDPGVLLFGNVANVAGPLSTSYAERVITPYLFQVTDIGDLIRPLGMPNRSLGGGAPDAYTPAVPYGGTGPYNVGLLVRTTGKVVRVYAGRFWIDDGSPVKDSWSAQPAVMVDTQNLSGWMPPLGAQVSVTGISGASTLGGLPIRILRPRTQSDVVVNSLKVAYIYYDNPTDAQSFESLLDANGLPTDTVFIKSLGSTDMSPYQVILIGDDVVTWNAEDVTAILETGRPVIGIGEGGARFLDQVTVPDLYIGWGHSAGFSGQTHAIVYGGDIYSYPYNLGKSPGDSIYLYYSPESAGQGVHDPDGVSNRMLRHYTSASYFPLANEDRFYQWGFYAPPSAMTGYGRQLFVNLVYSTARN